MPIERHLLMGGALHIYRREKNRFWQCATYLGNRNHRQTTKEESLAAAKDFAHDWYTLGFLMTRLQFVAPRLLVPRKPFPA